MINLVGMDYDLAVKAAEANELKLTKEEVDSSEPLGKVLYQNIEVGTAVPRGQNISVRVSNGVPPKTTVKLEFAIPTDARGNFHITL